ncbi:hypothetical protein [Thiohalocapsa marina]|uniref:hypothetical protein n=1 Tax=Thiohalocapsa marina TaxID=424902 RepID=UPI001B87685E|nr:hypothetical protein [Thiohalocapsa marina]
MRNIIKQVSTTLGLCLAALAGTAQAADEALPSAPSGADMANTCAACHGTNGALGDEYFVPLAGMPLEQFVSSMLEFRNGARPATLMGFVASGFSDDEIRAMGAFYAAMPLSVSEPASELASASEPVSASASEPEPAPTAQPAPVAALPTDPSGADMANTCAACHGTNGVLGDEYFVPLAGMPLEQFVSSMLEFRNGARPATLMGFVASGFSDAEIRAMGEFFAAIQPSVPPRVALGVKQ